MKIFNVTDALMNEDCLKLRVYCTVRTSREISLGNFGSNIEQRLASLSSLTVLFLGVDHGIGTVPIVRYQYNDFVFLFYDP